jgi:thiamine transport system ATP-binding protein
VGASLEVRDLTVVLGGATVLSEVSFDLPAGQVLAVLGPSGCGKSTLLRAVAGIERPGGGRVVADGDDLAGVPVHRRGFALMFQDGQLFPHLSVGGNVAYPLRLRRVGRRDRETRVAELLELVGVPGYAERDPATLSGGERQRVALARALAVGPRLLLLDEPLSSLDRDLRERLAADLRRIVDAAGTTALLVTHDHDEAFAVADRMALLRAGRLVQEGTVSEIWQHPADAEAAAFLGYARVVEPAVARQLLADADGAAQGSRWEDGSGMALRRSALRVDDRGPVTGEVCSVRSTPEQLRLVVGVDGLELDAVAPTGRALRIGETVRLSLDVTRIAAVPASSGAARRGPGGSASSPSVD